MVVAAEEGTAPNRAESVLVGLLTLRCCATPPREISSDRKLGGVAAGRGRGFEPEPARARPAPPRRVSAGLPSWGFGPRCMEAPAPSCLARLAAVRLPRQGCPLPGPPSKNESSKIHAFPRRAAPLAAVPSYLHFWSAQGWGGAARSRPPPRRPSLNRRPSRQQGGRPPPRSIRDGTRWLWTSLALLAGRGRSRRAVITSCRARGAHPPSCCMSRVCLNRGGGAGWVHPPCT